MTVRAVRFITASSDPEGEATLARSLGGLDQADLYMRCTDKVGALAAIRSGLVQAALLIGAPAWFDRSLADEAREHGVNLIGVAEDPFEADELLRLGCILVGPTASPETIMAAAASPPRAGPADKAGAEGNLVVAWGPKGAPGVTSIAIEIAFLAARRSDAVALVDADTYGPSCKQALAVDDDIPSLVWAARAALRAEREEGSSLWPAFKRIGDGGPVLLPGIPHPGSWSELSGTAWKALMQAVSHRFEVAVIDAGSCLESDLHAGPGLDARNHVARTTVSDADHVVTVADGSPIGLRRLIDAWPTLIDLRDDATSLLVINRVQPADAAEVGRLCRAEIGKEPDLLLPFSRAFTRARRIGRSVTEMSAKDALTRDLQVLTDHLWGAPARRGVLARLSGRG